MQIASSIIKDDENAKRNVNDSHSNYFKCQECDVCFTTKEFVDQHIQTHTKSVLILARIKFREFGGFG